MIRLFLVLALLVPLALNRVDDGNGLDPHGGIRASADDGSGLDPHGKP